MKVVVAQINPTVGDLKGNVAKIIAAIHDAKVKQAALVVFPELTITGYPPKDLLAKQRFVEENKKALGKIANVCVGISAVVGFVDFVQAENVQGYENVPKNTLLYNAAAVLSGGKVKEVYHKHHLPNYDVFDEKRYFTAGSSAEIGVVEIAGKRVGVTICEDIWIDESPAVKQVQAGAELIVNISASPFHQIKSLQREELLAKRSKEWNVPVVYANLVGGQDDLIFDGRSYYFVDGKKQGEGSAFKEELLEFNINNDDVSGSSDNNNNSDDGNGNNDNIISSENNNEIKDLHDALVLGIKDYFQKNGFKKALIGLSGGIDSALTAALAVEALGSENVVGITMPSGFSSSGSVDDSLALAQNLRITCDVISIKEMYDSYLRSLTSQFSGTGFNVAEENIQARIRGNVLMAMANKFNHVVLATGNKSELAVGYATLYGDMAGGLAVLCDVLKTKVYAVSRYINQKQGKEVIPESTLTKEPSAELREEQKDSDSLPEYAVLDPIIEKYVEQDKSSLEIVEEGFADDIVHRVISMIDRAEYKRNQAALGFKVSPRAFGSGRRMPITNKWNERAQLQD